MDKGLIRFMVSLAGLAMGVGLVVFLTRDKVDFDPDAIAVENAAITVEDEDFSDAEIEDQKNEDAYIVALTLFAEARGESFKGRMAVASVIWNRAHGHVDMLAEVCLIAKQFSCWNGKSGERLRNLDPASLSPKEAVIFEECFSIAKGMIEGRFVPLARLKRATHYHAKYVRPYWSRHYVVVAVIGGHIFYKS